MKKCVGCNKTYDDTWKVCLLCREPLVELGQADSKTEQPHTPQAGAKEKRPVGIKVLAVLFIFSGIMGSLSFFTFIMPQPQGEITVERFREEALKRFPDIPAEELENFKQFTENPFLKNVLEAQNEYINSPKYKFMLIITGLMSILLLVIGVGFLKLKEWSRKAAIFLHLINIPLFIIFMRSMFTPFLGAFQEGAPEFAEMKQVIPVMLTIQGVVITGMVLAIIYYLTRPKVKEHFKP